MSIHPSLSSGGMKKHRSVLKRNERIKILQKEEKWKEDDSPFGLPKLKRLVLKLKKSAKPEEAAEATPAEGEGEQPTESAEGKKE